MKGPIVCLAFALAVMAVAVIYAPRCEPGNHSGKRIGSVMMIQGCR